MESLKNNNKEVISWIDFYNWKGDDIKFLFE